MSDDGRDVIPISEGRRPGPDRGASADDEEGEVIGRIGKGTTSQPLPDSTANGVSRSDRRGALDRLPPTSMRRRVARCVDAISLGLCEQSRRIFRNPCYEDPDRCTCGAADGDQ